MLPVGRGKSTSYGLRRNDLKIRDRQFLGFEISALFRANRGPRLAVPLATLLISQRFSGPFRTRITRAYSGKTYKPHRCAAVLSGEHAQNDERSTACV